MEIRVRVRHELETLVVDPADIVKFEISNRIDYTSKGTFKRFLKSYRVQVGNELYTTTDNQIDALKEALQGSYDVNKFTVTAHKGLDERKAIDYSYKMKA